MDKYEITIGTFDRMADKYQEKYLDFDFYHDTYDRFCELVTNTSAKILDVACGPGNTATYLRSKRPDWTFTGFDAAPRMVQLARQAIPDGQFEVRDARDIGEVAGTYDAIMCGFCCPYISHADVEDLIPALRSRLKENGILYLSTMEGTEEESGLQIGASGNGVFTHYYEADYLKHNLLLSGFEIVELRRKQFDPGGPAEDMDLFFYCRAV